MVQMLMKLHKCELNAQKQQQLAPEHPAIQMAKILKS